MSKRTILKIRLVAIAFFTYFAIDFPVRAMELSYFKPHIGLKCFLPTTIGLLTGIYGIIGEVLAVIVSSLITKTNIHYIIAELLCVIIPGLSIWLLWNAFTNNKNISFKRPVSYMKYAIIVILSYSITAFLINSLYGEIDAKEIIAWYTLLSFLIGLPALIIYRGIFCITPILPRKRLVGEEVFLKNDIVTWLSSDVKSISVFNELLEDFALSKKIDMKKIFEVQNLVEEIYLRITNNIPDVKIHTKLNYDVTFSIEFSYESDRFNPLKIKDDENEMDVMGIKLIKHRALLASYDYLMKENFVHVVI